MDVWVPMELPLAREREETAPDAVIDINTLSLSASLIHNSTSHHSLSFHLYLSLSFFLLYKIFFWYVCTPLKHPFLSNVKSFDFDLQISRSLFSFLLSLICVSYSERVSRCAPDDGTGSGFGLKWRQESGKDYRAPMWEVGSMVWKEPGL